MSAYRLSWSSSSSGRGVGSSTPAATCCGERLATPCRRVADPSARAACPARSPRPRRRPAARRRRRSSPCSASQARCLSIAATMSSMPSARGGDRAHHLRPPLPGRPLAQRDHALDVAVRGVGAVPVGLVDHEDVGDLEDARLDRLDRVAHARARAAPAWCRRGEATSTSAWPTPTVSTSTTSQPAPSSTRTACGVAAASPPRWPAAGHRADVDARVGRVVLHPDPVAEDRAAGERAGRVDGEHADPMPAGAKRPDQLVGGGRLAHSRRAGQADDLGPAGVRGERGGDLRAASRRRTRPA